MVSIHSLPFSRTTSAPSKRELYSLRLVSETTRWVLRARCSSRVFCFWACWIAWVVPIIAGQAAMEAERVVSQVNDALSKW